MGECRNSKSSRDIINGKEGESWTISKWSFTRFNKRNNKRNLTKKYIQTKIRNSINTLKKLNTTKKWRIRGNNEKVNENSINFRRAKYKQIRNKNLTRARLVINIKIDLGEKWNKKINKLRKVAKVINKIK